MIIARHWFLCTVGVRGAKTCGCRSRNPQPHPSRVKRLVDAVPETLIRCCDRCDCSILCRTSERQPLGCSLWLVSQAGLSNLTHRIHGRMTRQGVFRAHLSGSRVVLLGRICCSAMPMAVESRQIYPRGGKRFFFFRIRKTESPKITSRWADMYVS